MSKILKSNLQFDSSPAPAATKRYPRLEEIKRTLFPLLAGTEAVRSSNPRFADLVDRFAARRSL